MPRTIHDWKAVQAYYDQGHGFVECSRRFAFCHTAWIKAIKRGALKVAPAMFADRRRRYDWSAVQTYYDAGARYRETQAKFGFCNAAWTKAIQRGEIVPRRMTKSIGRVLMSRSSRHLKKAKLIREGHLLNCCYECGIAEWRGRRLVIQIDHINGVRDDWRIENLRMLCPNCHSQTETFSGRNLKRAGVARAGAGPVV
jgi:5-methylcytosine-specific restriction endonuclease McrA